MTLIELLVVLTILALLTVVAVTSSDVLLGQGRYEATKRTLTNIEEAVLGPANARQSDGTSMISGFLADMGRLPKATGNDPATMLSELWSNPDSLAEFRIRAAPSDGEVLVASGWRGPYLRLPVGKSELRDGWGNAFQMVIDNSTGEITAVKSRGADGLEGGIQYDADLSLILNQRAGITAGGGVYLLDGSSGARTNPTFSAVAVRLFGPHPATGEVLELPARTEADVDGRVRYTFDDQRVAPGLHYLRAYLTSGTSTRKSAIVPFQQTQVIDLDIK